MRTAAEFRVTRHVDAPPERTWQVWVDASRFPQWQGAVLAVRDLDGRVDRVGSRFVLDHGPKLKRQVRVLEAEAPSRHVIEQTGMGVHDLTTATFEPDGTGTRLTIRVVMHLGGVMRVLARFDRRSRQQREFEREIDRFVDVVVRQPGPARVGGVHHARSGAYRRRLTVLDVDDHIVHVRLHPGHLRDGDPDGAAPRPPKSMSDTLQLDPLPPPIRGGAAVTARGLPFLARDGGHGVAHLALSTDAWADAAPRDLGTDDAVTAEDRDAIDHWRIDGGPAVGVDPELDLAPLCALRLGTDPTGQDVWAVAKVLRSEILRIHLAIYGDHRPARPDAVRPWRHRLRAMSEEAFAAGEAPDLSLGIGHVPLHRAALSEAQATFAGVTSLLPSELDGYRMWRDAKGGTFDDLAWLLVAPLPERSDVLPIQYLD